MVHIRTNLEQALRTKIGGPTRREVLRKRRISGGRKAGPAIAGLDAAEPHQTLAVMRLGDLRLGAIARNVIIDRGDAGGHRMPPGRALDGRQARMRQRIAEGLHADIGEDQNVQLGFRDRDTRPLERPGQCDDSVGYGPNLRHDAETCAEGQSKQDNLEFILGKRFEQAVHSPRYGMGAQIVRVEPQSESPAGHLCRLDRAMRRRPFHARICLPVKPRQHHHDVAVVLAVVGEIKRHD